MAGYEIEDLEKEAKRANLESWLFSVKNRSEAIAYMANFAMNRINSGEKTSLKILAIMIRQNIDAIESMIKEAENAYPDA